MASANHLAHLARRALGSLRPGPPRRADRAWVASVLTDAERRWWERLRHTDQRHAVAVARRVAVDLGEAADRRVLAAALLHDVGKAQTRLGVPLRVAATLAGLASRHDPAAARAWADGRGGERRIGLYLLHPEVGADMLRLAGSDPLVVAWAREHHLPPARWTVPVEIGDTLKAADDD